MRHLVLSCIALTWLALMVGCGPAGQAGPGAATLDIAAADSQGPDAAGQQDSAWDAAPWADGLAQPGTDAVGPPTDAELAKLGIVKLTAGPAGVETGQGATDFAGIAAFYSPVHNALVEVQGVQGEQGPSQPAKGAKVAVRVGKDASVLVFVTDPTGALAPAWHAGKLVDGKVEVDGAAAMADGKFDVAWAPDGSDPFEVKGFSLVGVSVAMVIRVSLRTAIGMAIGAAVKSIVDKTCLFFNPLYTGWCSNLGDLAKELTGVAMAGIWMKFDGVLTWSGLVTEAGETALNWLVQKGCEKATGALLVAMGPVTGLAAPLEDANVGLWKKVAHKAQYIIEKDSTAPSANPGERAMVKSVVQDTLRLLAAMRPMVQKDLLLTYGEQNKSNVSDGKLFTFSMKMVEKIGKALKQVVTTVNLTTIVASTTTYIQLWDSIYIANQTLVVQQIKVRQTTQDWAPKGFSQMLSCAIGLVDGFAGVIQGSGSAVDVQAAQFANDALKLTERLLDEVYGHVWGGTIAAPSCYPDLFEPNDEYNVGQAAKNLGDKVTIDGLTLGKGDVDWFTLPLLGAWAKVQAGVAARVSTGADDCPGGTLPAKLCVQMFWHSNIIELSGTGPVAIGSEHCGSIGPGEAADPQLATQWYNVSKVTGEQNQKLLVRVRHPPGQDLQVPYKAMMFAGGIF